MDYIKIYHSLKRFNECLICGLSSLLSISIAYFMVFALAGVLNGIEPSLLVSQSELFLMAVGAVVTFICIPIGAMAGMMYAGHWYIDMLNSFITKGWTQANT